MPRLMILGYIDTETLDLTPEQINENDSTGLTMDGATAIMQGTVPIAVSDLINVQVSMVTSSTGDVG